MSDKWYISGPLGIGTEPDRPLHVTDGAINLRFGSEANVAVLRVENAKSSSSAVFNLQNDAQAWQLRVDGSDGNKFTIFDAKAVRSPLTIDTSGNVGIGTTTPSETLEVTGRIKAMVFLGDGSMLSGLPGAKAVGINETLIDVRTKAVDVGSISITAPVSGYVVVRFDGHAIASTGDSLLLAASNASQRWEANDGNVNFYGDGKSHPFSHSRFYPVSKGFATFYAVALNARDTGGDGRASIYGTLTVEFFPREL